MDEEQPEIVEDEHDGRDRDDLHETHEAAPVEPELPGEDEPGDDPERDQRTLLADEEGAAGEERPPEDQLAVGPVAAEAGGVERDRDHHRREVVGVGHEREREHEAERIEQIDGGAQGTAAVGHAERPEQGVEGDPAQPIDDDGREPLGAEAVPEDEPEQSAPEHLEDERRHREVEDLHPALFEQVFDGDGVDPVVADGGRGEDRDDRPRGDEGQDHHCDRPVALDGADDTRRRPGRDRCLGIRGMMGAVEPGTGDRQAVAGQQVPTVPGGSLAVGPGRPGWADAAAGLGGPTVDAHGGSLWECGSHDRIRGCVMDESWRRPAQTSVMLVGAVGTPRRTGQAWRRARSVAAIPESAARSVDFGRHDTRTVRRGLAGSTPGPARPVAGCQRS